MTCLLCGGCDDDGDGGGGGGGDRDVWVVGTIRAGKKWWFINGARSCGCGDPHPGRRS